MCARPCCSGKKRFPLPDFGIAGHFINRVVDVHCILDHCAVLKHLDLLGNTSDGKVVTVTVKLNTETQVRIQSLIVSGLKKMILTENVCRYSLQRPVTGKKNIKNVNNHTQSLQRTTPQMCQTSIQVQSIPFCTWRQCWSRYRGHWHTRGWRAAVQSCSG